MDTTREVWTVKIENTDGSTAMRRVCVEIDASDGHSVAMHEGAKRGEGCATRHSIPVPPYEAVCEWSPASGAASSPGAVATNARGIRRSSAGKANR